MFVSAPWKMYIKEKTSYTPMILVLINQVNRFLFSILSSFTKLFWYFTIFCVQYSISDVLFEIAQYLFLFDISQHQYFEKKIFNHFFPFILTNQNFTIFFLNILISKFLISFIILMKTNFTSCRKVMTKIDWHNQNIQRKVYPK